MNMIPGFLLLLGLTGTYSLPSFKWMNDRSSDAGVPFLAVAFGENDVDYAVLEPFNPIPLEQDERHEDVDGCIFKGHLVNDPDASVVMTGGCPFTESFEMLITSNKLNYHMYKVENGKVTELESPFKGSMPEIMHAPSKTNIPLDRLSLPATGMTLNVGIFYDQLFKSRFGTDSLNAVRRVMAFAQTIYNLPSLTTQLKINTVFIRELPISITGGASSSNLNLVQQYAQSSAQSNIFLTFKPLVFGPNVVGIGFVEVACDPDQQSRVNLNNWASTDVGTGLTVAHEVGHNLGMYHDFNGSKGSPRFDSTGRTCTNIGGVMDYDQTSITWTRCSVEDFTRYFNRNQPFCLLPGFNSSSSQQACVQNGVNVGCVTACAGVGFSSGYKCSYTLSSVRYSCSCSLFRGLGRTVIEEGPGGSFVVVEKLPIANFTLLTVDTSE